MEYTSLGNSSMMVSRICMGCMGFGEAQQGMHGWTLDEGASREIIKHGLECGVNFFDTAIAYQGGSSERFLGQALRDFAKRDEAIVATKFLPRTDAEISNGISGKQHISNSLNKSLENLGMEYIDLYICHKWDERMPVLEMMETLNEAVQEGKVRAIGISNCFAWQIAEANALAARNGWAQFVSVQGHYNLVFREEEREMAPYCRQANIAMTPYSPLASGRLVKSRTETSQRLEKDTYAKSKYDASAAQDQVIIDRVAQLAERRGLTKTQIALGWLLTKVSAPIVGSTKLSHIDGAVQAVGIHFSQEELAYLEEPYVPHPLVGMMALSK